MIGENALSRGCCACGNNFLRSLDEKIFDLTPKSTNILYICPRASTKNSVFGFLVVTRWNITWHYAQHFNIFVFYFMHKGRARMELYIQHVYTLFKNTWRWDVILLTFFLKLFQAQAVSKAQLDILHQLSHWNEQRFMILKQRVYTLISSIF